MPAFLRLEDKSYLLQVDRITIGTDASNTIILQHRGVGRLHAVLEPTRSGWSLRDLGAYAGTFVNGKRIWQPCTLRDGDRIQIGDALFTYVTEGDARGKTLTGFAPSIPSLDATERIVLIALCRPLLVGDVFSEPTPLTELQRELGMTRAALSVVLQSLYGKFGIYDEGDRRRLILANRAVQTGAVSPADL